MFRCRSDAIRALLAASLMAAVLGGVAEAQGREPAGLGEMCAGIMGIQCRDGLQCDLMPGVCGGADISGTCIKTPEVCTREYLPVCGCDGKTYGNDCERRSHNISKDRDGEC